MLKVPEVPEVLKVSEARRAGLYGPPAEVVAPRRGRHDTLGTPGTGGTLGT